MSENVTVVIGPTASGKSAYGLELAARHNGVIVNFDSMQVYDALPILAAQPTAEEQAHTPHMLYGYIDPALNCNAAKWTMDGVNAIKDIQTQGQHPILVGGTGLYLSALIYGLSPIPDCDPEIRLTLNDLTTPMLTDMLRSEDPDMLAKLKPNDTQRMIRALEVIKSTGKSLLWWQDRPKIIPIDAKFDVYIKNPDRDILVKKIHARTHQMFDNGALDEVKDLVSKIENGDVAENAGITKALGFTHLREYLDGKISRDTAIELTQIQTRQYAKRQRTYLRGQLKETDTVKIIPINP